MKVHRAIRHLLLGATVLPAAVHAQGFGLNEIGSCAIARGFAVTSGGCRDASVIYWNPAAITRLNGKSGLIGVAPIAVGGDFTQDTTGAVYQGDVPTEFPPHLFWASNTAASRLAYGIGVYVPYGLTNQWGDGFPGRFSVTRASIQTVYVQPTVAFKINPAWSVGVGPIVGHSAVELSQALDLADQRLPGADTTRTFGNLGFARRTEFGRAKLTGDAWGFGFSAGLHGILNERWQVGVRYLHKIDFAYDDADATFTQTNTGLRFGGAVPGAFTAGSSVDSILQPQFTSTGRLGTQRVNTRIAHPAQVQAGFTYTGWTNTDLSVEYAWLGWKAFKELPVDFENTTPETTAPDRALIEDYNNASSLRAGLEHRFMSGFASGWAGRLGASAATSAAPPETVTPLLPEQDRYTLNLGAGIPLTTRWALDASYAYVGTWGSRGRIDERTSRAQTAAQLNTGFYRLSANILSISLKATY